MWLLEGIVTGILPQMEGNKMINWTDEKRKQIINLKNQNLTWAAIAQQMSSVHDERYTTEQCRAQYRQNKHRLQYEQPQQKPDFNESIEIKKDGSHRIESLVELSNKEKKDPDSILIASGYDPAEWQIRNVKFSRWHHFNRELDEPKTLYAIKLDVEPITNGFNFDKLLESIKEVPKVDIQATNSKKQSYLSVPTVDMHFPIMTYEDYKGTQNNILNLIEKGHQEILFVMGNDLFHHNDHQNRTASGREIEQVDITQGWEDAKKFYYPLLEYALMNSEKVTVMYIKGNHSETLEWCFMQMLKERYGQIDFMDEYKERKVHMLGLNYIGCTHGDKKKMQNLPENFATEFPAEWSIATTRTVLTGHLHHEKVIDKGGIVLRQLPTAVKADKWHTDQGYTTAHRRFQAFEYDYDSERCIHYV